MESSIGQADRWKALREVVMPEDHTNSNAPVQEPKLVCSIPVSDDKNNKNEFNNKDLYGNRKNVMKNKNNLDDGGVGFSSNTGDTFSCVKPTSKQLFDNATSQLSLETVVLRDPLMDGYCYMFWTGRDLGPYPNLSTVMVNINMETPVAVIWTGTCLHLTFSTRGVRPSEFTDMMAGKLPLCPHLPPWLLHADPKVGGPQVDAPMQESGSEVDFSHVLELEGPMRIPTQAEVAVMEPYARFLHETVMRNRVRQGLEVRETFRVINPFDDAVADLEEETSGEITSDDESDSNADYITFDETFEALNAVDRQSTWEYTDDESQPLFESPRLLDSFITTFWKVLNFGVVDLSARVTLGKSYTKLNFKLAPLLKPTNNHVSQCCVPVLEYMTQGADWEILGDVHGDEVPVLTQDMSPYRPSRKYPSPRLVSNFRRHWLTPLQSLVCSEGLVANIIHNTRPAPFKRPLLFLLRPFPLKPLEHGRASKDMFYTMVDGMQVFDLVCLILHFNPQLFGSRHPARFFDLMLNVEPFSDVMFTYILIEEGKAYVAWRSELETFCIVVGHWLTIMIHNFTPPKFSSWLAYLAKYLPHLDKPPRCVDLLHTLITAVQPHKVFVECKKVLTPDVFPPNDLTGVVAASDRLLFQQQPAQLGVTSRIIEAPPRDVGNMWFRDVYGTGCAARNCTGFCAVLLSNVKLVHVRQFTRAWDIEASGLAEQSPVCYAELTRTGYLISTQKRFYPVYHVVRSGSLHPQVLQQLVAQQAYIGAEPMYLKLVAVQITSFAFSYFAFLSFYDAVFGDKAPLEQFVPGKCYKRLTDEDLGWWPTLERALKAMTKGHDLSITSNGLWYHVHSYRVPNAESAGNLLVKYTLGSTDWCWQKRVGAASPTHKPVSVEIPHASYRNALSDDDITHTSGMCYKHLTTEDLGYWPKLSDVLMAMTKNHHMFIRMDGDLCHVQSERYLDSLTAGELRAQFLSDVNSFGFDSMPARWERRVGGLFTQKDNLSSFEIMMGIITMLKMLDTVNNMRRVFPQPRKHTRWRLMFAVTTLGVMMVKYNQTRILAKVPGFSYLQAPKAIWCGPFPTVRELLSKGVDINVGHVILVGSRLLQYKQKGIKLESRFPEEWLDFRIS